MTIPWSGADPLPVDSDGQLSSADTSDDLLQRGAAAENDHEPTETPVYRMPSASSGQVSQGAAVIPDPPPSVATQLQADLIDGKTVTGGVIRTTLVAGARAVLSALGVTGGPVQGVAAATLALFSGHARETSAGGIAVDASAFTYVMSPILSGQTAPGPGYAELELNAADGATPSEATLVAGNIYLIPLGGGTLYLGPLSFSGASDVAVQMNVASLDIAPNSLNDTRVPVRIGGREVPNTVGDLITVTTDAGGLFDLPHGLGTSSHAVVVMGNQSGSFSLVSRGASTDVIHAYTSAGANKASSTFNVSYIVTAI